MDARYWYEGCQRQLHFQPGVRVTASGPSVGAMRSLFGRKDDWLYLAGHFQEYLYNYDDTTRVKFQADRVTLQSHDEELVLKRGEGFQQHARLKVLFWGGCNVHSDPTRVRMMRALFGTPVMVGWRGVTNRFIMLIVMGGMGHRPPNPARDFFERIKVDPTDMEAIRNAWLQTGYDAKWGRPDSGLPYKQRFSVVDRSGQEYILGKDGIIKGGFFG
jgi:hypothetical protein